MLQDFSFSFDRLKPAVSILIERAPPGFPRVPQHAPGGSGANRKSGQEGNFEAARELVGNQLEALMGLGLAQQYAPGATPLDPNELAGLIPKHITLKCDLDEFEQANILQAQGCNKRNPKKEPSCPSSHKDDDRQSSL